MSGVISPQSRAAVAASGLDLTYLNPTEYEPSLMVSVLYDGAEQESFDVMAAWASDIAEVIFESCVEGDPDKEIEVSVTRTNFGTGGDIIETHAHYPEDDE